MSIELDDMEYPTHILAQGAFVSSEVDAVYQSYETGGDGDANLGDSGDVDYWHAIQFTTASEILCSGASIYLNGKNGNPTGDLTFRIETDVATEPSGTLAHANATGTVANASIVETGWNKCSFTPFTLAAGTYWLVVYIPDQATNVSWNLFNDNNGVGKYAWSNDHAANWTVIANFSKFYYRIYDLVLQCYSEDIIIKEGNNALKGIGRTTVSLNDTLTRTVDPTIDLSDQNAIEFWIRSSRTGQNIKIGIHDSGGVTTEITPNILAANTWQKVVWIISGVPNENKNAIDQIIITIVNAD